MSLPRILDAATVTVPHDGELDVVARKVYLA